MNLPTTLTISRILLIPVMLVLYFVKFPYHMLAASLVFIIAAATDFLDGYLARKNDQVTTLGKFLDPIADKVLVASALFIIVEATFLYKPPVYPLVCAVLIIARELMIDAFRLIASEKGVVISADKLGKAKTLITDIAIFVVMCNLHEIVLYIGWALLGIATLLTIVSGLNYVIKNKVIRIKE